MPQIFLFSFVREKSENVFQDVTDRNLQIFCLKEFFPIVVSQVLVANRIIEPVKSNGNSLLWPLLVS